MSYMRNGYQNGETNTAALGRFNFGDSSREASDAERSRSRPGNYGYGRNQSQTEHVQGPSRLDRQHANRRSRDYNYESGASRSRSRPNGDARYGLKGGDVEEILRYIETHFFFMGSDSCVPIKVALQLMDPSSLGLQSESEQFAEAHHQLQNALKVIVNEHHQGFNSSIGTFHKIQAAIHASQHRVRTLRAGLLQAKANLATNRPELKAMAMSSQSYDQMLRTLDTIEELQIVPDRLEAQIREKRYLGAAESLLEALKLIRKPELEDIGALSELRVRLSNQEQILTDMLVEELHNHLYLKSPYCEERWKSHVRQKVDTNGTYSSNEDTAFISFLNTYDGTTQMQEDPTRNAEADTFYFIQLLLEALHKMGKLDIAADRIEDRLPTEFHRLLERTLSEVEQSHAPSLLRSNALRRARNGEQIVSQQGLDSEQKAILEDLLATLYAKFQAIAESHRVLHEVTAAMLRRDNVPASEATVLNRSFRELWKLLQAEIRSLLHDHLATNGNLGGRRRQEKDASANIFRPQPRDRTRKLFKLADTVGDVKSTELATEREDLEFILKASVPGLVNSSIAAATKNEMNEREADRSATGHKLLIEPSVFNMGILLAPSLTFLHTLREIVPAAGGDGGVIPGTLTTFLDDFLINVFYPQLDETLLELCSGSVSDVDTFQPDPQWERHAARPIFKGAVRFYALIERFCGLLDDLPHEQAFSQLLITQMRTYYDSCYTWSKGLLQRIQMSDEGANEGVKMRLAAELATSGDLNETVIELLKLEGTPDGIVKQELTQKEADNLLLLAKSRELEDADLIQDRKALAALCTLQVSMKWLASKCKALRFISSRAVDSMGGNTNAKSKRWTSHAAEPGNDGPTAPYLPLDEQTAEQFDAVIISFVELSTLVLRTLHIDMRLQLLQGVYKAMDTTYLLNQPYHDPDPNIVTLSNSISTYDAQLSVYLLPPQYGFLTSHLHTLVNTTLMGLTTSIQAMDSHGLARMHLNILVLQQTLKNLNPPPTSSTSPTPAQASADLERAARFYELGSQGPQAIIEVGPKEGFAPEDLKALCRLCWDDERDAVLGDMEQFVMKLGGWPTRKTSLKGRSGASRGRRSPLPG